MRIADIKEKLVKSQTFVDFLGIVPDAILQQRKKPKILIEVTNTCNLKCPLCPTAHTMTRKRGFMSLENFKIIIDEIKDIKSLAGMNFAGEPTLNKDLFKMVKYTKENNMDTTVSTNGTMLHKFNFDDIIHSGLTHLSFSLDGITQETLGKYRVGGNFIQITENLKSLINAKNRLHSDFPIIEWQFVVMKHNQHEIPEVKKLAEKIGVNILSLKSLNVSIGYDFSKDSIEEIEQKTGIFLGAKEYSRQKTDKPLLVCPWIWSSVILWNGDVTTCCFDFNGEAVVGNVFEEGFKGVWKSKEYVDTRKKILRKELEICKTCRRLEEENQKQFVVLDEFQNVIPKAFLGDNE